MSYIPVIKISLMCVLILLVGNGCLTSTCTDGVKNGDESDIDCGGSCKLCPIGGKCRISNDCDKGVCSHNGICEVVTQRFVFVTPFEHRVGLAFDPSAALKDATFASAADADKICQSAADASDSVLHGFKWAAWIWDKGDPYARIISRIDNKEMPVFLLDGTTQIAHEMSGCAHEVQGFDCAEHMAAIDQYPNKTKVPENSEVWIGDSLDNCNNWANGTDREEATLGEASSKTDWISVDLASGCNGSHRLYCIMVDEMKSLH